MGWGGGERDDGREGGSYLLRIRLRCSFGARKRADRMVAEDAAAAKAHFGCERCVCVTVWG